MSAAPTPESIAQEYLDKYPGLPLKAFWESLTDFKHVGTAVPMTIVLHPSCGVERRSVQAEGPMATEFRELATGKVLEYGATPIIIAAQANRHDVVEALVDADALVCEPTEDCKYTALHAAAANNMVESISLLLQQGSNPDAYRSDNHRTPMHAAAFCGHVEAIQALIEGEADKEPFDKDDYTPMHLAAMNGHVAAIKALVEANADKESFDKAGYTPMHLAAMLGHVAAIEALIDSGADPNASIVEGPYPLHFAAHNNHPQVIELLLSKGAMVNATFQGGHTALHMAAQYGHVKAIAALLKGDADASIISTGGERLSAWDLAEMKGHGEAVRPFRDPAYGEE